MGSENYLNNPLLKKANTRVEYSEHELSEYIKCAGDPKYFIKNYMKIVNLDEGIIKFNLRDYQEEFVDLMHSNRFVITLQPRQAGKTNTTIAYILHYILFNEHKSVAILANKEKNSKDFLGRLKLAYENLPMWIQQGVLEWNKSSISLENGSKVFASATSSSAVRSGSYNLLLLDELAFVPRNIQSEFFASAYPTISSGTTTKVFISSTPGGFEMFYKLWQDANSKKNGYVPFRVDLGQIPGRDQNWKDQTRATLGEEVYRREHLCEFIGSHHTLIDASKLSSMPYDEPLYDKNNLKIYENPIEGHTYFMTADVAYGKEKDYSTLTVFDITHPPYKQCAIFRDNTIAPMVFPTVIESTGKKFNDAYALIEINDVGLQVAAILYYDIEYENVLLVSARNGIGQTLGGGFAKSIQPGVKMTKQVKKIGCTGMKSLIENDKLLVRDFNTISELSSFVLKGGSYAAEQGNTDDLVMNLVLFSWAVNQAYFGELLGHNIKESLYGSSVQDIEENLIPVGLIDSLEDAAEREFFGDGGVWQAV